MLKNLIEAFRGGDALREMLQKFDQMLDKADWVFTQTSPDTVGDADMTKVRDGIYARFWGSKR